MAKSSLTGLLLAAVVGCSSPELKMLSEEQLAEKEQLTSLAEQLVGNNSGRPKLYDEEAIHSFLNRSLGLVLAIQENAFGITHDQIPEIAIQVIELLRRAVRQQAFANQDAVLILTRVHVLKELLKEFVLKMKELGMMILNAMFLNVI